MLAMGVTRREGGWDGTGVRIADVADCYEKHAEALLHFAATQVGAVDAEDVVSAAIVGVLQTSVDVDDLQPYLYRAVANAALKHWRTLDRRSRRERLAAGLYPIRQAGTDDKTIADPEVVRALTQLSPQQRAVVHLTYWEDLTPAATATRLGVRDGTVRKQLARARSTLRKVLHDEHN